MVDEFGSGLAVIGKRNPDYVADDIVKGEHVFAEDVMRAGKLYGRILGSKYAKAKITGINTAKAEALEGVKAVITYKEVSTWSDQMLCVDQEVAAVAAVDEDTAERALDLIEVTYNVEVPVIDPDEAMKPGAPNTGVFAGTNVTPTPSNITYGDVAKGFTEADVILEEETGYVARHTHNQIEGFISTAWWQGNDCYIWAGTQNPFGHKAALQAGLTASLKLANPPAGPQPLNKVHFYNHGTGGGFGNKGSSPMNLPCALLSRKAGKAVTLKTTRKIYTVVGVHQYAAKMKFKIGAKNDGTLTAVETTCWSDGGKNGGRSAFADIHKDTWKCANFKSDIWGIATNKGASGAWRCVGHPAAGVLSDLMLEKLAVRLKINPLELRRKIFLPSGAGNINQQNGQPYFSDGIRPCLEKAAELIGYSAKYHEAGTKTLPDGRLHGIGIHARADGHGGMSGARGIIINMCEDGTALFNIGGARNMGGPGGAGAVIAETIGLTYDQVRCGDWGNTDVCAEGGSQGGSTYTISNGAAAMVAANDVRRQLFIVAGSKATGMLQQWARPPEPPNPQPATPVPDPTDAQLDLLEAKEGKIFLKSDPTKSVTHAQVMAAISQPVIGRGVRWDPVLRKDVGGGAFKKGGPGVHKTGAACAVEVAVDPDTGHVEVLNYVNVLDFGRVMDRNAAEGQMVAGLQVEFNQMIYWEDVYDPITGVQMGYNHIHDRLCTSLDIPEDKNVIDMLETIDANGPYGCHGIAEPSVGKACVFLNAVNNAIGKWIIQTPTTPRTILRALGKG